LEANQGSNINLPGEFGLSIASLGYPLGWSTTRRGNPGLCARLDQVVAVQISLRPGNVTGRS